MPPFLPARYMVWFPTVHGNWLLLKTGVPKRHIGNEAGIIAESREVYLARYSNRDEFEQIVIWTPPPRCLYWPAAEEGFWTMFYRGLDLITFEVTGLAPPDGLNLETLLLQRVPGFIGLHAPIPFLDR